MGSLWAIVADPRPGTHGSTPSCFADQRHQPREPRERNQDRSNHRVVKHRGVRPNINRLDFVDRSLDGLGHLVLGVSDRILAGFTQLGFEVLDRMLASPVGRNASEIPHATTAELATPKPIKRTGGQSQLSKVRLRDKNISTRTTAG